MCSADWRFWRSSGEIHHSRLTDKAHLCTLGKLNKFPPDGRPNLSQCNLVKCSPDTPCDSPSGCHSKETSSQLDCHLRSVSSNSQYQSLPINYISNAQVRAHTENTIRIRNISKINTHHICSGAMSGAFTWLSLAMISLLVLSHLTGNCSSQELRELVLEELPPQVPAMRPQGRAIDTNNYCKYKADLGSAQRILFI